MGAVMALYITIILYNFSFVKEISKFEPLNRRSILIAKREGEAQGKFLPFQKRYKNIIKMAKKCRPVFAVCAFLSENKKAKDSLGKRRNQYFTNIIDKK